MTINYSSRSIQLTKKFAKAAQKFGSDEYNDLQAARRDNPTFKIVIVSRKTNTKVDTYKGLTYEYMRNYIILHTASGKERIAKLAELEELILISHCHGQSKRYPTIKKWFLNEYPDVAKFGIVELHSEDPCQKTETNNQNVIPMHIEASGSDLGKTG